jgi:serine/threonine-protein kinase RsbT
MEKILIQEERDIVICRQICRQFAYMMGFNLVDQTRITTAASELARNIQEYAGTGEVTIEEIEEQERRGIKIVFEDHGPGIPDIDKAMSEGWSSHRGIGMGLPGTKKLMDDFKLESQVGKGTKVTIIKWLPGK